MRFAAFGVARRRFEKNRPVHGDRLELAGVDNRHVERQRHHPRRSDTRYLGGEDARGMCVPEARGDLLAHLLDQVRVHLVVEDAVDLEDAVPQIQPLGADAILQNLHDDLPFPVQGPAAARTRYAKLRPLADPRPAGARVPAYYIAGAEKIRKRAPRLFTWAPGISAFRRGRRAQPGARRAESGGRPVAVAPA